MRETERVRKTEAIREEGSSGDAIEHLFRDEARSLWRALVAFTGGRREVAEDAMAEAFARALRFADGIRDPRAYVYATAFRLGGAGPQKGTQGWCRDHATRIRAARGGG